MKTKNSLVVKTFLLFLVTFFFVFLACIPFFPMFFRLFLMAVSSYCFLLCFRMLGEISMYNEMVCFFSQRKIYIRDTKAVRQIISQLKEYMQGWGAVIVENGDSADCSISLFFGESAHELLCWLRHKNGERKELSINLVLIMGFFFQSFVREVCSFLKQQHNVAKGGWI